MTTSAPKILPHAKQLCITLPALDRCLAGPVSESKVAATAHSPTLFIRKSLSKEIKEIGNKYGPVKNIENGLE
ncbi:hypothetical protein NVS47_01650 [Dehalobacterium formicoaceticum]|uniref:Uncharacterized protein n=1 Tax=Dehalobacterium formicoaceticum TaxID=51515 RepID=A0ABT1Y038_9FIRM|nr:hypothetical protein [Dehalobacterium formicoaceticum]MCR6544227.1 hypothetical protein [Dehalobacterium formicoaceticum]